jgi:hypothetical protein
VLTLARWLTSVSVLVGVLAVVVSGLQLAFIALGGHARAGHDAVATVATLGKVLAVVLAAVLLAYLARRGAVRVLPAERGEVVDEHGRVILSR